MVLYFISQFLSFVPSILQLSPSTAILILVFVFSVLKFLFDSFYIICPFAEILLFSQILNIFIIACRRIFIMAAFNSLSGNSNLSVISVLASVDRLFSFNLRYS